MDAFPRDRPVWFTFVVRGVCLASQAGNMFLRDLHACSRVWRLNLQTFPLSWGPWIPKNLDSAKTNWFHKKYFLVSYQVSDLALTEWEKGLIEIQHFRRAAGIDKSLQHQFVKDRRFSPQRLDGKNFAQFLVIFSLLARYLLMSK